jgi:hypothetical protein
MFSYKFNKINEQKERLTINCDKIIPYFCD